MSLQKKTLTRYRQLFPLDTLRETSGRTGIQITRVFRLFNGKSMKVGELEAFERAIALKLSQNPNFDRLAETLNEASAVLTNEELGKIRDYVQRKVMSRSYSRFYVSSHNQESISIA